MLKKKKDKYIHLYMHRTCYTQKSNIAFKEKTGSGHRKKKLVFTKFLSPVHVLPIKT
jgi:hypothetical protein